MFLNQFGSTSKDSEEPDTFYFYRCCDTWGPGCCHEDVELIEPVLHVFRHGDGLAGQVRVDTRRVAGFLATQMPTCIQSKTNFALQQHEVPGASDTQT